MYVPLQQSFNKSTHAGYDIRFITCLCAPQGIEIFNTQNIVRLNVKTIFFLLIGTTNRTIVCSVHAIIEIERTKWEKNTFI